MAEIHEEYLLQYSMEVTTMRRGTGEASAPQALTSLASPGLISWAMKHDIYWIKVTCTMTTNTLNNAGRICTAKLSI